jgi:glucosamine-6-phosphate deaminase
LKIEIAEHYDDLSRRAGTLVRIWADETGAPSIVLPTGNTPLGLYREPERPPGCLARARLIQLDEYYGIGRDDRRTLGGWLDGALLQP